MIITKTLVRVGLVSDIFKANDAVKDGAVSINGFTCWDLKKDVLEGDSVECYDRSARVFYHNGPYDNAKVETVKSFDEVYKVEKRIIDGKRVYTLFDNGKQVMIWED